MICHSSASIRGIKMADDPADVIISNAGNEMRSLPLLSADVLPGWFYKESYTFLAPDGQANVMMSTEPLDEAIDSDAYTEIQGSMLENEFPGYQQLALEPYVISGVEGHGWLREFSWNPEGQEPVQQTQIYVVLFGRGCTVTATSLASEYEKHRADLAAVFGSIAVHTENAKRLHQGTNNS